MSLTTAQTILIVDDEIQNRKLLETLLRPEGYRMLSVANGAEALSIIADHSPDLILLDVMMPGMDGYQVAEILKAAPATSDIPIIMVTALGDRAARVAGLSAGVEDFLTKPVDRTELCLRVRNLLRLKAQGDLLKEAQEKVLGVNAELEVRVEQRTAQLQASYQELEAFSYSVSHDLRTPLSSIAGFSSLVEKKIGANAETALTRHYLSRIRTGVVQMGASIDALLSLAQVSRAVLRHESVDFSAIARSRLELYCESEPDRLVKLDIEPGLVVEGDPQLLRKTIDHLLGNAWKFSARKEQVNITFRREIRVDGSKVYAVQDNGCGFDMAYSDKLFQSFQRLHSASEFPGAGIGLATVRRIVARHGGKVWAESVLGQGATFYFTLGLPAVV